MNIYIYEFHGKSWIIKALYTAFHNKLMENMFEQLLNLIILTFNIQF